MLRARSQRGPRLLLLPTVVAACAALLALPLAWASADPGSVPPDDGPSGPVRELLDQGRLVEAEAAARALLAETARRDGEDTAPWAAAAELLAKTLLRQEKTNEASLRDLTERALRVRERAQTEAPGELIASLRTFGDVLVSTGDSAGAKAAYERALALMEQPGIGTDRDRAGILNDLGTVQLDTGERDKARANWERARQLGEAQLDPRDPEVAMTLESLATLQRRDGNLEQAQQLYARALRLRQQAAGPDSLAVAGSLMRFEELWVTSSATSAVPAPCANAC